MRNAHADALGRLTKRQKAVSRREAKRRQREAAEKVRVNAPKEVAEAVESGNVTHVTYQTGGAALQAAVSYIRKPQAENAK